MEQKYVKILWLSVIIILFIIVVGVIIYFVWHNSNQGWKCTENGCEKVLHGKFHSKSECDNKCSKDITKDNYNKSENYNKYDSWTCTSNYNCIPAEGGDYTNKEACEKNCIQPVTTYYNPYYNPYYYPQTLLPRYYFNHRPRYWSYRGFGRPIRHGGRKISP